MRIHQLTLRNFISYLGENSIVFPDGLTVIVGQNGAGKTSLLDAISYALYKTHGRGRTDIVLINSRAQEMALELTFSAAGREYQLTWNVRKGRGGATATATLRHKQGKILIYEGGEKTILPEVEKITGIDKDVFLNAIYVRQGEITKLLDVPPAERKKVFATLLGIEMLEKLYSELWAPLKELNLEIESLNRELAKTQHIEERLMEILRELSKLGGDEEKLHSHLKDLETKVKEFEEKFEEIEKKRHQHMSLLNEKEEIEKEIIKLDERRKNVAKEIGEAHNARKNMAELEKDYMGYKTLKSKVEELKRTIETMERKEIELKHYEVQFRRVENEIKGLQSEADSLVGMLANTVGQKLSVAKFCDVWNDVYSDVTQKAVNVKKKLDETSQEIGSVKAHMETLTNWVKELRDAAGACPLCGQPISDEHKNTIINSLRADIDFLHQKLGSLEILKSGLLEELKSLEKIKDDIVKLNPDELQKVVNRVDGLKIELDELGGYIQRLKGEVEVLPHLKEEYTLRYNELVLLEQRIEPYLEAETYLKRIDLNSLQRELSSLDAELEKKRLEVDSITRDISELAYDDNEYERFKSELKNYSEALSKTREELARVEERRKGFESERKRLEDELKNLEVVRKRLDILQGFRKVLETVREGYGKDGVQRVIRERAKTGLEYYARRFFAAFNMPYSDLAIDDELNVTVMGPDGLRPIESLSGGEKVAVALSLRLALAATLAGDRLECIIMDEPTVHLDVERRRELIQLLSNFKGERKLLPQAIIVSHDVEVADVADQVYEVVKEDEVSKVRMPSNLPL
jgi:exonuclease SbcC